MPIEKLRTGGTADRSKRLETCRMVPSPPSVTTRSTLDAKRSLSSVSDHERRSVSHFVCSIVLQTLTRSRADQIMKAICVCLCAVCLNDQVHARISFAKVAVCQAVPSVKYSPYSIAAQVTRHLPDHILHRFDRLPIVMLLYEQDISWLLTPLQ